MEDLGINGKILNVIREMYRKTEYSVRLNGLDTDWFQVTTGLKQGRLLLPLLFNFFINNLVESFKSLNIGIDVGEEKGLLLLYADDLVLLAENENDMQILLDILSVWWRNNKLQANETKSNIIISGLPTYPEESTKSPNIGTDVGEEKNSLISIHPLYPEQILVSNIVAKH